MKKLLFLLEFVSMWFIDYLIYNNYINFLLKSKFFENILSYKNMYTYYHTMKNNNCANYYLWSH